MNLVILYRDVDIDPDELLSMKKHFRSTTSRMDINKDDLVIGRYSVLPFYEEQELDIIKAGARLINTYQQHRYVADIGRWYNDLKDLTPRTWCMDIGTQNLPNDCSFILKGETNSMKRLWSTHMFAKSRLDVADVYGRLLDDSLIGYQKIYAREYVPLKQLGIGLNGLPITKEFRFFIAYNKILSGGFYWSSHIEDIADIPSHEEVPYEFVKQIVETIDTKCDFYTIDIAITEQNQPILIELNDGQMAGLSENNPDIIYRELRRVINESYNIRRW